MKPLTTLEETRRALLTQAPDDLEGDEIELWWIVAWVQMKQSAAHVITIADPGRHEALRRKLPGLQDDALAECRAALEVLQGHLNNREDIDDFPTGPTLWTVSDDTAGQINDSLAGIEEVLGDLQARKSKPEKPSRPPGTVAMYTRVFWPLLEARGYSMRRASKLLAEAFQHAGLDCRADNIYQAIRNRAIR